MCCSVERQQFSYTHSFGRPPSQKKHKMPKDWKLQIKVHPPSKQTCLPRSPVNIIRNYLLSSIPCAPVASSFVAQLLRLGVWLPSRLPALTASTGFRLMLLIHIRMQIRQLFSLHHPSLRGMNTTPWFCSVKNKYWFNQLKTRPEKAPSTSGFTTPLVRRYPEQWAQLFLSLPLAASVLKEALLVALHIPHSS